MTIRRCVAYHNYLRGTLTFDLKVNTALWSCPHIPNIIDLSGKTKKLWSRQASLRRSGSRRKNHTKTICLPSFEGERDISFRYLKQFFLIQNMNWKTILNRDREVYDIKLYNYYSLKKMQCIIHVCVFHLYLAGIILNAVKLETWKFSSMPTLFLLNFIKIIKLFWL
jgi:hypothetical protein